MLHEFQHLINASVNQINGGKAMDLWLNEALSESTSVLFAIYGKNKMYLSHSYSILHMF